ncbi:hypothetical protein AXX12_14070 [Anaerosporomusa subterranea]|uniref:AraC family transcriptional regulator n=1 Tax=Anaerosporomusa subterranea TaxID=1794912 RepID=A0A154BN54_ANASB|nr:hypothetical protein [Anaerosporomusa subterranea]KYZ75280.1 hypothetical protein AXX12_14070 [Anaerosporomusa subterranea]
MVLNIANGTALKEYLTDKYANDEKIISFNESMITGKSSETVFNDEFFRVRAKSLGINYDQYLQITVAELDELLNKAHSKIVLWFDEDMFCQINLLTLYAYLDSTHFDGEVRLNIIPQNFYQYNVGDIVIKSYELNVKGYYSIYKDVMIRNVFTKNKFPVLEEMQKGIRLYENYISDNSEIRAAIKKMVQNNQSKLYIIKEIIEKYSNYGIGDYNIELLYNKETLRDSE